MIATAELATKRSAATATASATVLKDQLNGPTSVVRYDQAAWITEGQLGHLFGSIAGPPSAPFLVRRVDLP